MVGLVLALGLISAPARAAATPGSFTVGSVTSSSAVLSWTASSGAIGYRVYRGPSSAADSALTLISTTDAAVVKYTAANLRSGFAYKFAVAALDVNGTESPRAVKTATTTASTDTTAPAAPSSTSVQATAFSSARVDVIWGASSSTDVAYYEVLRGGVVVGTVDRPMSTRFSDNGLAASTTYSYQVRAVDSAGNPSALTTTKSPKTLAAGTVKISRGPYSVRVGATSATIIWWTNIPTTGQLSIGGSTASDNATAVQHRVAVTGLTAGTRYSYTVTSGAASATGNVRTARPAGQPYTFAVIGDYGAASTAEQQNATNIAGFNSDFLQTVGDNIYPSAGFPDPDAATTYSDLDGRIFKQFGPVFKSQGFFPANGNHEYYANGQFWNAFPMPGSNSSWYSYNWGDAHVLVLDSIPSYASGTPQYAFAKADLESAAAQNAKWRIVVVPNPPYNTSTSETGGSSGTRAALVPLFDQNNVDLVLSGDAHNYQRSKPLTGGQEAAGGVTYIVSGGGGNGTNAFTGTMPTWQAFRQAVFESLKVEVAPTSLKVSAIAASNGAVIDSVTLGTPDTQAPSKPANVRATATTTTSVSLAWDASTDDTGVAHYNVYRNGALVSGAGPTGTTYTDSGLTAGTTYSYEVSAVDAAGNESPKSPFSATTAGGGGTAVQATLVGDATIDPAASPTSSRLKVDASSPQNDMLLKFSTTCTTVNAAHLKLTVGSGSTDPSVKGGDFFATSSSDANAGWSESSVAWASAPAKTGSPVTLAGAVTAGTTYDIDVTSLVPATGGTFTIRGSSTSGDGAGYFSKEGSATLGPQLTLTCASGGGGGTTDTQAPSVPANVVATPSSTSVALKWDASSDNVGVDHYNVYRGTNLVGSPTTNSYNDSGLTASTQYSYQVSAVDAAGNESAKSAAVQTTTTSAGGGGTTTVAALEDATIDPALSVPPTNKTRLKVDASAPQNDLLIKFAVPSTCTTVTAAHLKLTVGNGSNDPSSKGGDFYAADPNTAWSESSVVWGSAPAKTGNPATLAGAVTAGTTYDIDVTSLVPATLGTFTIRGSSTSGDGAGYYSKEDTTGTAPQLVLTCG